MGLFIHLISKYLWITYCVLSTVLGVVDTLMNQTKHSQELIISNIDNIHLLLNVRRQVIRGNRRRAEERSGVLREKQKELL